METHAPNDLDRLGDEIAELSAHLDAATARLLELIREFDARGGWNTGFPTCAHWLSWRVGLDLGAAREKVRVARALADLPRLAEALALGQLSYSKVRALTRVATPETEEVFDDEDGMVMVRGRLTPEAGALLRRALEAGCEMLYRGWRRDAESCRGERALERPTLPQQRADALALVAESALQAKLDPGSPGERYQVVVHVDAGVLSETAEAGQSVLEDGAHVSAETSKRLSCDAGRIVMRHEETGKVVEVGTRTRTISPALRRALQARDRGCRFPGCGVRVTQGHHLRHWAHGGPTTLSNLALLCRRHHRSVHEEGYQVQRMADESLRFRRPDGEEVSEVPMSPGVPSDPVGSLLAANAGRGLEIDARTSLPSWTGERLDLVYAMDVLHPRARQSALVTWSREASGPRIERPIPGFCDNDDW